MKKLLSILLVLVMLVSMVAGLGIAASAADADIEAVVTEMTVGGNTIYVYAPANESVLNTSCSGPAFVVFGDEAYTAESAKAAAQATGLADIAAAEGTTIVFVNPQGDAWTEADAAVYSILVGDVYAASSSNVYVNGIAETYNYFTGATSLAVQGDSTRAYIYGFGSGADFAANYLMKSVISSVTYPDGFSMTFDRTPTSVTLVNPTAIPTATESADIAVAVVNGPADTAAKLAGLTDKVLVDTAEDIKTWIVNKYTAMSGAYRRQVGILVPVYDWAAEGITEKVVSYTTSDGVTINSAVYYADDLNVTDAANPVPMVLTFHGGGNTALYQAQASEWPIIGKANGFITVSVDLHYPNVTAAQTVELIEYLESVYAIDASRIYASGFSMGSVKSWDLFEQYPTLFAGLAPMDGSNEVGIDSYNVVLTDYNSDVTVPVFYVGGQTSPLAELANQATKIQDRIAYAFSVNGVKQVYAYDESVNLWWGVNGDIVYQVTDQKNFTDSTLNVHLFQSLDGKYYTALADATNQSHEVYGRNSWAAWDFLSQFSRNADGSISIEEVTYTLASDDSSVTDNSYNISAAVVEPEPDVEPETTTYTVAAGDCLWNIAAKYLGSGYKWSAIYEANKGVISDPNMIYVGQILVIPVK